MSFRTTDSQLGFCGAGLISPLPESFDSVMIHLTDELPLHLEEAAPPGGFFVSGNLRIR